MRTRCNNPNYKQYADYGGRGIKVCERWNSFTNFIADMGPRPKGYSIERIDVDGDYEPANCKWANAKEQCRNKRNNHFIEYQGHMITGIEYREITGLSRWKTYNQRSVLK